VKPHATRCNLDRILQLHGLRRLDMERAAGMQQSQLSRIATNGTQPTVATAIRILEALRRLVGHKVELGEVWELTEKTPRIRHAGPGRPRQVDEDAAARERLSRRIAEQAADWKRERRAAA
jgi:transcriptional regulator with XRE-family HTH domain